MFKKKPSTVKPDLPKEYIWTLLIDEEDRLHRISFRLRERLQAVPESSLRNDRSYRRIWPRRAVGCRSIDIA